MFSGEMWDQYRDAIADIESSYVYDIKGGANDHYDGAYQMGRAAKEDAGKLLGETIGHDEESRKKFREDPELQERAFKAFTQQNHLYLTRLLGEDYVNLPDTEKMALLGYAHNQGVGGAIKYARGEGDGKDAFGTKGSRYASTVRYNMGTAGPTDYATVLRHEGPEWFQERGLDGVLEGLKDFGGWAVDTFKQGNEVLPDLAEIVVDGVVDSSTDYVKNVGGDFYKAVEGDNPYTIAKKHGMTLEDLVALNPEVSNDLLKGKLGVGQELKTGQSWYDRLF